MLIDSGRCLGIANQYIRTPENWTHMTAAVSGIAIFCLIEVYDENAVSTCLKRRVTGQRRDHIRLQPSVRLLRGSVVCIVVDIRNDVRELGQGAVGQVDSKL